jgi:thiol-disulfide isomerase/thioredoxin
VKTPGAISLLILALGAILQARAENCPALPAAKQSALVDYVRRQYKIDESTDFRLAKEVPVVGGCYRALTFEGKGSMKTWQLTLYLSPDQRFLSGELFDTTLDPIKEEQRKADALMTELIPNKGASKGPATAPVTIVEFSDFECPFCRRFAALIGQLSPAEKNQIRIVFHHLPLSIHQWARMAAEGAACAQLQSSDAFWAIHDKIFQHQEDLTPGNFKQKLAEYAQDSQVIDLKSFQECVDNQMSLGLVFQDMNLPQRTTSRRRQPRSSMAIESQG